MKPERVPCSVPGCTRSMFISVYEKRHGTWADGDELICAPCWKRATKAERRVRARIGRLERKHGPEAVGTGLGDLWTRQRRTWAALKRRLAK